MVGVHKSAFIALAILLDTFSMVHSATANQFDADYLRRATPAIQATARSADIIFVGIVQSVGSNPRVWSGELTARQMVTYRVDHVIKGTLTAKVASVEHLVVRGSSNAGTSAPSLSKSNFGANKKLIIIARMRGSKLEDIDENYGTIPYSSNNEKALRDLL